MNYMTKDVAFSIVSVAICLMILLMVGVGIAFAADQEIELLPNISEQVAWSTFALTVQYNVSDQNETLTSLGVRIHFDSSKLDYTGFKDLFTMGNLANPQLQNDISDKDDDNQTDKIVLLSYSDPFDGKWPNQPLPLKLVKLLFTVKSDGKPVVTEVNVSKVTGHAGYGFSGRGATLNIILDE